MKIALIAHDKKKTLIIDLVNEFKEELKKHDLYATGTTGKLIEEKCNLNVMQGNYLILREDTNYLGFKEFTFEVLENQLYNITIFTL